MHHVPRLVAVGMGPGDPELVTCKAARILGEADVVLVPVRHGASDAPERVELSVRAHLDDASRIRRVEGAIPGQGGPEADDENWELGARLALQAFADGAETVVFATLGDPSLYSSFAALADAVAESSDVQVEVVPGITAMQALAAAARVPLAEGTESLTLVPAAAGLASFTDALERSDTVVAYRGGRYLAAMHGELRRHGRLEGAVLGEQMGFDDETIAPLADLPSGSRSESLATVIVPAGRDRRGARR